MSLAQLYTTSASSALSSNAPRREGVFKSLFIHLKEPLHREIEKKQ